MRLKRIEFLRCWTAHGYESGLSTTDADPTCPACEMAENLSVHRVQTSSPELLIFSAANEALW